jgi:hypothetical protein
MPRKKPEPKPIQIDSIKHADESRANIPTNELRDFVADDEHNPQMKLYPRNPDDYPQLVWKGKDEQDNQDLEIPILPIYTQEKIHPLAIIQDILDSAKKDQPGTILSFQRVSVAGCEVVTTQSSCLLHKPQRWSVGTREPISETFLGAHYGKTFSSL